jgi:hypothetical protein
MQEHIPKHASPRHTAQPRRAASLPFFHTIQTRPAAFPSHPYLTNPAFEPEYTIPPRPSRPLHTRRIRRISLGTRLALANQPIAHPFPTPHAPDSRRVRDKHPPNTNSPTTVRSPNHCGPSIRNLGFRNVRQRCDPSRGMLAC